MVFALDSVRRWQAGTGQPRAIGFLILVCIVSAAEPARGHEPSTAPVAPRAPQGSPKTIEMSIGFYLIDIARISTREELFDLEGYLDANWFDPALAKSAGSGLAPSPDDPALPIFEFVNSIENIKFKHDTILDAGNNGYVRRRIRFGGKFSSPLKDVRHFPFDYETLHVYLTVFDRQGDHFVLNLDRARTGRTKYAFVTDWDILRDDARITHDRDLTGPENPALLDFSLLVQRRSHYYYWRALLPMVLLVMISWVVFWFEPTNLQPQISTALGVLLSLVTFTFSIDASLPKVMNLTFIDRYALMSLIFVLSAIVAITAIHVTLTRRGVDSALVVQAWARWIFPAAYVVAVVGGIVISFW
jgi:hypothetical protein